MKTLNFLPFAPIVADNIQKSFCKGSHLIMTTNRVNVIGTSVVCSMKNAYNKSKGFASNLLTFLTNPEAIKTIVGSILFCASVASMFLFIGSFLVAMLFQSPLVWSYSFFVFIVPSYFFRLCCSDEERSSLAPKLEPFSARQRSSSAPIYKSLKNS